MKPINKGCTKSRKQLLYLLSIMALLFFYTACNDSNSGIDIAWKYVNDKAYQEIVNNPDYKELKTETGPSGVYYKAIGYQSEANTVNPLQTSTVKVLYYGAYYDGTVFDLGSRMYDDNGELVEQDPPYSQSFSIAGTIRGFSFALQNMTVGDEWDIWIPYWLGYGETGYINTSTGQVLIKGYTTLHYVVKLVEIIQYP
jgi:FKBP-type peptidyl-prolyl cis-trans isomerase